MFNIGEPWYMLDPDEWHAFGYGLIDGLKVWQRSPICPYDDIDKLPLSPEWRADIKAKYHYYWVGFELPETIVTVLAVSYFLVNNTPLVMGVIKSLIGAYWHV